MLGKLCFATTLLSPLFVCESVATGLRQVALMTNIGSFFVILTFAVSHQNRKCFQQEEALEARGVDASRFTTAARSADKYAELRGARAWPEQRVWSKGRAGEMKVDFFPVIRERRDPGDDDDDDDDERRQPGYGKQPRGEESRAGHVGSLGRLLVQQGFELKVSKPDDGRWQPVSAAQVTPCAFSVPSGPSEVTLELVPAGGNVAVRLVNELDGSAHWADRKSVV